MALIAFAEAPQHRYRNHPECPERIKAVVSALDAASELSGQLYPLVDIQKISIDALKSVHTEAYLTNLHTQLCGLVGPTALCDPDDPDGPTFATQSTLEDALHSVSCALACVDAILSPSSPSCPSRAPAPPSAAFSICRPPGHHATPSEFMGFCFLNAVAAAARHAQRHHGIQKVAILDWDVHHGNGTQEIFYSDPSVLFIDVHRDGVWPESGGHAEEKGNGPGVGTTINVPLPAGAGHTAAMAAFEKIVAPALRRFDPGLILVSAGYDAHWKDPLETLQFQSATYHALAAGVRAVAEEVCGGRVVFILEGGYDCASLGESVAETVRALVGLQARTEVLPPKAMPQEEPEALVEAALGAVAKMGCELSKRGVALL